MYSKPEIEIIVLEEDGVITSSGDLINGGQGTDQEIELPDL